MNRYFHICFFLLIDYLLKGKDHEIPIPCSWEVSGEYEIEAKSLDEALKIAELNDDLPKEQTYIDSSFRIDYDCAEADNIITLEKIKIDKTPKEKLPLLINTLETKQAKEYLSERMKKL